MNDDKKKKSVYSGTRGMAQRLEHRLLFQRSLVQFPAPHGDSKPSVTAVPGTPSSDPTDHAWFTHTSMRVNTYTQIEEERNVCSESLENNNICTRRGQGGPLVADYFFIYLFADLFIVLSILAASNTGLISVNQDRNRSCFEPKHRVRKVGVCHSPPRYLRVSVCPAWLLAGSHLPAVTLWHSPLAQAAVI